MFCIELKGNAMSMDINKLIVISGCSGGGKSTLLAE